MSCNSLAKIRQDKSNNKNIYQNLQTDLPEKEPKLMVKENGSGLPQRPANSALDDRKDARFS